MAVMKEKSGIGHVRKTKATPQLDFKKYLSVNYLVSLLVDTSQLPLVSVLILVAELFLNIIIVNYVKYTEIDWKAYMQECEGFLNGTTNYELLKGDTGPLVYPAGFVYIYSIFYYITSRGENILLAQYIFIAIYMLQSYLVLRLFSKSRKIPPYVLLITSFTSYRIHSIYVLRLFNDPIAMVFLYLALNLFFSRKWYSASIAFSIAVSIKMNILLFAPAILLLYITNLGYANTIIQLVVCGIVQLALGLPFLLTYPLQYIRGSFDLGRIFEHKWTVNYRFLSVEAFTSKPFHLVLLCFHLTMLLVCAKPCYTYMLNYCRLRTLEDQLKPQIEQQNRKVEKERVDSKSKIRKHVTTEEEENLTDQQKDFLKRFETSLKSSASNLSAAAADDASSNVNHMTEKEYEKYAIHFDKSIQLALLPIFLANFIGIIFARSLHYQFYVWYFHSLPYLAWYTEYQTGVKFLLLGLIELAWNTYPSTIYSSLMLHACHLILLTGILKNLFKSTRNIKI